MEENNINGWVSLHRKSIKWKWYKDPFVKAVFNHCVLMANHEDGFWRKYEVKRGQLITSREKIANANGLSVQQVRTCLSKLESTKDLIVETTNHYTKITVVNYDKYQTNNGLVSTSTSTQNATNKSTSKNEDISTNKLTNKIIDENIENKEIQENEIAISTNKLTNKNEDISTNVSTQNITSKSTTNNNILINNNNIILLNYTKLNLLFNYLIDKEKPNFENLKEKDKIIINSNLKRLEIFISTDNVFKYLDDEQLLDYKLQYYAITQIYLSPYKAYLDNLNKSNFLFRFFKAKQYTKINTEDDLVHFINYFIVCLREEMEKNGNN